MKVRVLVSCVSPYFTITEGETIELPDEHCPSLIARGCIEPIGGSGVHRAAPAEVAPHEATPAKRHAVKGARGKP